MSYQSKTSEMKKKLASEKQGQWDASTTASKANAEDRIAAKIA